MVDTTSQIKQESKLLKKAPTGIQGFDEVVHGGLPQGRTTLVCGGPGSGKTLFATEFLVRGAQEYGEPGVFMAFEETAEELAKNVASLGMDLEELVEQKKIFIDYVHIERSEIKKPVSMTWRGCSYGWLPPSRWLALNGLFSIPSRRSSPALPMNRSYAQKSAGCSAGCRTGA